MRTLSRTDGGEAFGRRLHGLQLDKTPDALVGRPAALSVLLGEGVAILLRIKTTPLFRERHPTKGASRELEPSMRCFRYVGCCGIRLAGGSIKCRNSL